MNTQKPRNRYRLTSAEQKLAADRAQRELNALGARLMVAYFGGVVAFVAGVALGAWL